MDTVELVLTIGGALITGAGLMKSHLGTKHLKKEQKSHEHEAERCTFCLDPAEIYRNYQWVCKKHARELDAALTAATHQQQKQQKSLAKQKAVGRAAAYPEDVNEYEDEDFEDEFEDLEDEFYDDDPLMQSPRIAQPSQRSQPAPRGRGAPRQQQGRTYRQQSRVPHAQSPTGHLRSQSPSRSAARSAPRGQSSQSRVQAQMRWPVEYACPDCEGVAVQLVDGRPLYQCEDCGFAFVFAQDARGRWICQQTEV
jgi:hypothetical protein